MKKIFLFIVLFLYGFGLYGDNFYITPTNVDLGEVIWKTEKEFYIKFINKTNKPVTINYIKNFCSCIKVYWKHKKQKVVMPGKEVKVKVKFFGKSLGYFGKVIKVSTNYPGWTDVSINVKGKVVFPKKYPKMEIEKKVVELGNLKLGETKDFVIRIRNTGTDVLKINVHGFNSPNMNEPYKVPVGQTAEFYYKYMANIPGQVNEVIWIDSNDPMSPNVPIAVTGKVKEKRPSEGKNKINLRKAFPVMAFFVGLSFVIYGGIKFFS